MQLHVLVDPTERLHLALSVTQSLAVSILDILRLTSRALPTAGRLVTNTEYANRTLAFLQTSNTGTM